MLPVIRFIPFKRVWRSSRGVKNAADLQQRLRTLIASAHEAKLSLLSLVRAPPCEVRQGQHQDSWHVAEVAMGMRRQARPVAAPYRFRLAEWQEQPLQELQAHGIDESLL